MVECMQFQIPDVKLMFYLLWLCREREGGDIERNVGLRLLHRPRGSADAAQEKRNVPYSLWANWDQLWSGNVVSGAGQSWAMISQ